MHTRTQAPTEADEVARLAREAITLAFPAHTAHAADGQPKPIAEHSIPGADPRFKPAAPEATDEGEAARIAAEAVRLFRRGAA